MINFNEFITVLNYTYNMLQVCQGTAKPCSLMIGIFPF